MVQRRSVTDRCVIAVAAVWLGFQGLRPGGSRTAAIRMTDDPAFVPARITVAVGDTVVWVNAGSLPHTATDRPGSAAFPEHNVLPPGAGPWDSGVLEPGQTFRTVFTVPGEYTYLCLFHEAGGMVGRLTVR